MEEIERTIRRCNAVALRIHDLPISKITTSCKTTLLRLVNSELAFLSRLSLSPKPFCCNIGYIETIVHLLQQPCITKVSCVCKPIPLLSVTSNGERCGIQSDTIHVGDTIHVDIVCTLNNSPTWFVVSDRNPKYITWDTSGRDKGLKLRIEQIVHAAQSSQALKPASIVLFFANGLEGTVLERLEKEFGFKGFKLELPNFDVDFFDILEGEWVDVLSKSYQWDCCLVLDIAKYADPYQSIDSVVKLISSVDCESPPRSHSQVDLGFSFQSIILKMREWPDNASDMESRKRENIRSVDDIVNFDTTAVIALISGISNGGADKLLETPEIELRRRFKINSEFVISQAKSELENPIHEELNCVLSSKKGIICRTVRSEVMDIVLMCGGTNELMRAKQLLRHLKIVPDSHSQRMMSLPTTRKLALKNKVAFGTGDYWGAPTLTANMGFLRAISQTGMPLFTIEHRPRALIGD